MKARIKHAAPVILHCNLSENDEAVLTKICEQNDISYLNTLPQDMGKSVGYLCGFAGFSHHAKPCENPPADKCLIFSGIDRTMLNQLLGELKSENVSIPLKAICTPSNQSWAVFELIEELKREHEKLTGGANG